MSYRSDRKAYFSPAAHRGNKMHCKGSPSIVNHCYQMLSYYSIPRLSSKPLKIIPESICHINQLFPCNFSVQEESVVYTNHGWNLHNSSQMKYLFYSLSDSRRSFFRHPWLKPESTTKIRPPFTGTSSWQDHSLGESEHVSRQLPVRHGAKNCLYATVDRQLTQALPLTELIDNSMQ